MQPHRARLPDRLHGDARAIMNLIHRKFLIPPLPETVPSPAIALGSPAEDGGGGGRGIRARIRGDVEKPAVRGGGDDLRRHDVPVAGQALANPFSRGRVRRCDPLPRMSRVRGVRPAPHGRSTKFEVLPWKCKWCGEKNPDQNVWCGFCGRYRYSYVRRADLGAAGSARLDLSQTASPARPRARAWDVAARCVQLRFTRANGRGSGGRAACSRAEASHRATTSQSRAARMARADVRINRCSRDLRRAAKSMVRAGVAAG